MLELNQVTSWELEGSWKYSPHGWGSSLHSLCSRTGSFPPALAYYYIEKYSRPGDVVLDPFSGKGTAPLEACRTGRLGIGNDLAPEAYVLTHAKVKPITYGRVLEWVSRNRAVLEKGVELDVPEEVKVFYHRATLRQILAARELLREDNSRTGMFIKALILGILHGSSSQSLSIKCSHSFSMSPGYVAKSTKILRLKKPRRDIIKCLLAKAQRVLQNHEHLLDGEAYGTDARRLPLPSESVDFIITSPPYLNMQTYAWDNWLRLWFLGHNYKNVASKLFHSNSLEKFATFMEEFLREAYRVLKWNKACVVVLGVVRKNGHVIDLGEFVEPLAVRTGFEVRRIVYDNIPKENKYLMYLDAKQGVSGEVILELEKGSASENRVNISWSGDEFLKGVVSP
ncbi:MAG: DNA methyltransferase [Nitrososphaerota archaeon]|nr:DNA methyltransferase [Candidatus Calditenuaceae archaeon]MDW8073746.1 DNA methyltransferase [Nitrososphaerota archaeon]